MFSHYDDKFSLPGNIRAIQVWISTIKNIILNMPVHVTFQKSIMGIPNASAKLQNRWWLGKVRLCN